MELTLTPGSLASQLCPLGPKDRCTPSQAQAMGQQILALLAMYEKNKLPLPGTSSLILSLPLSTTHLYFLHHYFLLCR